MCFTEVLDTTRSSYRKYNADSDSDLLEAQNGAFWSALGRLGTLRWSRLAKEGPRTPPEAKNGAEMEATGGPKSSPESC